MRTNGEFDREIDARRNNTALRTVASRGRDVYTFSPWRRAA